MSMSISLIAVFIPILMMGGIVGRMFREFAVTLSVAVGISLIVSLTTTPTMCARFLKSEEHGAQAQLALSRERRWLPVASRWVREQSPLGAATPAAGVWHDAGNRVPGGLSLHCGSQGFLPAAGHRANQWQCAGPGGHVVCDHESRS